MRHVSRRYQKKASTAIALKAKNRLREGLLIFLSAIAVFFLISLITYHASDPGWSHSSASHLVANAGGRAGAWFADVFLFLFGYMAYLFPVMLAASAWLMFCEHRVEDEFDLQHLIVRMSGFLLALLSGCGLANLSFPSIHAHMSFKSGGILGAITSSYLTSLLNFPGTELILLTFFLIGITLFTGLSWLKVIDFIGKGAFHASKAILIGTKWLRENILILRDKIKDRRVAKVSEKKARVHTDEQPFKITRQSSKKTSSSLAIHKPAEITKSEKLKISVTGKVPSFSLLEQPQELNQQGYSNTQLEALSKSVEIRLMDFGIEVSVVAVHPGPVITRFELELAPGIKVSKITALVKDLARALSVGRVRVVEVIAGKSVIGLEIPNENRNVVCLREVLESRQYAQASSPLSIALGKDISGKPVIVDLEKMPHLLVAGTTGSGKSVSLNTMLLSLLFKQTPDEVRLIMVDPKMLELSVYDGIPHLLAPVVTDMKEAANAFRWCVAEMEHRYRLMASLGVRNLEGYNLKVKQAIEKGNPISDPFQSEEMISEKPKILEPLPHIVVIVDELADLMMVVGKKVEELIARIAQKARASGIHMILATQRPSVDVITGLIKANIPTRISFQVSSRIDSRTILDQQGAEQLLGYGDMLYLPPGTAHPIRIHGAFVSDDEVHRVVADWKKRGGSNYLEEILQGVANDNSVLGMNGETEQDPLYDQAVRIVTESRRASISYVQRRLKIGYNRAARILEEMENTGVVTSMENNGSREVLAPPPPAD